MRYDQDQFQVTLTLGISICHGGTDIDHCIKAADEALYDGKRAGKNRIFLSAC